MSDGFIGGLFDCPSWCDELYSDGVRDFFLEGGELFWVEDFLEETVDHGFVDDVLDSFVLDYVAADAEDFHFIFFVMNVE